MVLLCRDQGVGIIPWSPLARAASRARSRRHGDQEVRDRPLRQHPLRGDGGGRPARARRSRRHGQGAPRSARQARHGVASPEGGRGPHPSWGPRSTEHLERRPWARSDVKLSRDDVMALERGAVRAPSRRRLSLTTCVCSPPYLRGAFAASSAARGRGAGSSPGRDPSSLRPCDSRSRSAPPRHSFRRSGRRVTATCVLRFAGRRVGRGTRVGRRGRTVGRARAGQQASASSPDAASAPPSGAGVASGSVPPSPAATSSPASATMTLPSARRPPRPAGQRRCPRRHRPRRWRRCPQRRR